MGREFRPPLLCCAHALILEAPDEFGHAPGPVPGVGAWTQSVLQESWLGSWWVHSRWAAGSRAQGSGVAMSWEVQKVRGDPQVQGSWLRRKLAGAGWATAVREQDFKA